LQYLDLPDSAVKLLNLENPGKPVARVFSELRTTEIYADILETRRTEAMRSFHSPALHLPHIKHSAVLIFGV